MNLPETIIVCGIKINKTEIASNAVYNFTSFNIKINISYQKNYRFPFKEKWELYFKINGCEENFSTSSLDKAIEYIEKRYIEYYSHITQINNWADKQLKIKILK